MTALDALRDTRARVARMLEALGDGDFELVQLIGEDIEHDLAAVIGEAFGKGESTFTTANLKS
jgi:hypothetical protein